MLVILREWVTGLGLKEGEGISIKREGSNNREWVSIRRMVKGISIVIVGWRVSFERVG